MMRELFTILARQAEATGAIIFAMRPPLEPLTLARQCRQLFDDDAARDTLRVLYLRRLYAYALIFRLR